MLSSYFSDASLEAGVDEVGRGCLAGNVVAAAVIFPKDYQNIALNDSKKLSKSQRHHLSLQIKKDAITYAIAEATPKEIDEINILNASFLAMKRAILQLSPLPEYLLIDGNRFKTDLEIPFSCIIKGDGKYLSIAAASILAKTHRDEYMLKLHQSFPDYHWNQ